MANFESEFKEANEHTFLDGKIKVPVKFEHDKDDGNGQLMQMLLRCQKFCDSNARHSWLGQVPSTSAYYNAMPPMLSYLKCIHSTIETMMNHTTFHSLEMTVDTHLFQLVHTPKIKPTVIESAPLKETFTINIMCYEKNIRYILKYISFIVNAYDEEVESGNTAFPKITVICVCDANSFDNYRADLAEIHNSTEIKTLTPTHKTQRHNFTQFLHGDGHTIDATDIWNLRKCNVIFARCDHAWSAGVGGKRALIQYINYKIDTTFAVSMDDNITGIYQKKSGCKYDKYMEGEDPLSDKNAALFDSMSTCNPVNIVWLILQILVPHMRNHPDCLMAGVDKGKGRMVDAKNITGTISLYKLNISRPKSLRLNWYMYNPYFTRFAEDTTFNLVLQSKKQNYVFAGDFYLRFGHVSSKSTMQRDHEDFLPKELVATRTKSLALEPVYCMYILFAKLHKDADTLSVKKSSFICGRIETVNMPTITLYKSNDIWLAAPKESKYGHYAFFVYNYVLQYLNIPSAQNIFDIRSSYGRQTFYMLNKMGLITILPSNSAYTIPYKWTHTADLLDHEVKILPLYYSGNMALIKQNIQTDTYVHIGKLVSQMRDLAKEPNAEMCNLIKTIGHQQEFVTALNGMWKPFNMSASVKTRKTRLTTTTKRSRSKRSRSKTPSITQTPKINHGTKRARYNL